MGTERSFPELVEQKLKAFSELEAEFEARFLYVQEVQGQRRFPTFPIAASVAYLHALWVCDRKDRLLSVPRTIERYEGQRCLELLHDWQRGETAQVVAFLQTKLDTLPFAENTRQLEALRRQGQDARLAERVAYGRLVLLWRGLNLLHALESLFMASEAAMLTEVVAACRECGQTPEQIEQHLQELASPLLAYLPHPALFQRNLHMMDRLGVHLTANTLDRPGERSWQVVKPSMPPGPYAEQVIQGYVALTAPRHNNLLGRRFVDFPLTADPLEGSL